MWLEPSKFGKADWYDIGLFDVVVLTSPFQPSTSHLRHFAGMFRRHRIFTRDCLQCPEPVSRPAREFLENERQCLFSHADDLLVSRVHGFLCRRRTEFRLRSPSRFQLFEPPSKARIARTPVSELPGHVSPSWIGITHIGDQTTSARPIGSIIGSRAQTSQETSSPPAASAPLLDPAPARGAGPWFAPTWRRCGRGSGRPGLL